MPRLENLSPFHALDMLSLDKDGRDLLVFCVAGRFVLPSAGSPVLHPPARAEEQLAPPMADVYWGEPGASSLRLEGQTAYFRPGTDVYISGLAWSPRGRPTRELLVAAKVGSCQKAALVLGDRCWSRTLVGMRPSSPLPFTSMPLVYERSFGGKFEAFNPVGRGLYASPREALDRPLPNLEDPLRLIQHVDDRFAPVGFGPIARNWWPRLGHAGTYDEDWVTQRAPLWPLDFDTRFFQAAASGLVASPHLMGGEPIVLTGFSPDGQLAFPLPRHRLSVKVVFRHRVERRMLCLDTVHLEPELRALTLIWRAAVPIHRDMTHHEFSQVRELESWEDLPHAP